MNRKGTFECICLPDLYKGKACETGKVNLLYMTHRNHYNVHMQEKNIMCDMKLPLVVCQ